MACSSVNFALLHHAVALRNDLNIQHSFMLQNWAVERERREFCSAFFVRRALSLGFYNLY